MDCFCQFPPSSHNALSASKSQKGSQSHLLHTIKPYRTRRFLRSNIWHQGQQNIFVKKVAGSEFSDCSSCQSSATYSGSYKVISKNYTAVRSPDAFFDDSNIDKAVKKKCRKKARRKGKQSKNISRNSGSIDTGALSEYAHGSTNYDTYDHNDHNDHMDEQGSYVTSSQVSLPGGSYSKIDLDKYSNEYNCPKEPIIGTSSADEIVIGETKVYSTIRTDQVFDTETGSQVNDLQATETNHLLIGINNDMCSKDFLDFPDCLGSDSVSVGSNSSANTNANANASHSIKLCVTDCDSLSFSDMRGFDSREESFSCKNLLTSVEEACDNFEGSKYQSQNSCGNDDQLLVSGKKGKKIKPWPKGSTVRKLGTAGSLHGRTEKENNYSVWQKVRKNDVDGLKKVSGCSQFDTSLKQVPSLKSSNDVVGDTLSIKEDAAKHRKEEVSKKLKRKNNLGLKHECNYYNGSVSHSGKSYSNTRGKDNMQRNGILDITTQINEQKGAKHASRRYSQKSCARAGYRSNRGEFVISESVHGAKVFPVTLEALEDTHESNSSGKIFSKDSKDSSLPKSFNPLDHNLLKVQPPVYLSHHLDNDFSQNTIEDFCKQTHSVGSTLQKWIPSGSKDHDLITSASFESSLLDFSDGPADEDCSWRNSIEEKMASYSQAAVDPLTLGMDLCSIKANYPSCADDHAQNMRDRISWMHKLDNKLVAADCLTSESKELSAFEADSNKILHAMNDACRMRFASEAVQMATGDPIAEFEKILHLSSPIICQSHSLLHRRACLQGEVVGLLNSRHERPNLTLECLWKWYEKHGSYGLEVRAEDFENSKRIGVDRFSFRAYFVPFLSAVQLFKGHRRPGASCKNEAGASGVTEKCKIGEPSKDSNLDRLPIFSVLIPQPQPQPPSDADQLVDAASSNGVELLFEYFESDQPQTRQPLYEKVQELARGDVLSVCKMYGDPSTLVSVNVHDLHPRSWYSVAWYPIYRIPDGNLRAAFLTYHSLGHPVNGSFKSDSSGMDSSLVYPVVGLQSYNAQSECWFQPRHSAVVAGEAPGSPRFNASGILKERLRTLEETACLMARAAVNKGNQTSVNRHPDYEFFHSRRGQ